MNIESRHRLLENSPGFLRFLPLQNVEVKAHHTHTFVQYMSSCPGELGANEEGQGGLTHFSSLHGLLGRKHGWARDDTYTDHHT